MSELRVMLYEKDLNALFLFNSSIKCRLLDKIMPVLTNIGGSSITISTCLMIIAIGDGEIRKLGLQALAALALSHLFVHVLKKSVCRLRPKENVLNVNTFDVALDFYSFPSGHTTAVFVIAITLALNIHILAVVCFPIALIVAISRLYLGVHYPSDVLAGMAIAILSSVFVQFIMNVI